MSHFDDSLVSIATEEDDEYEDYVPMKKRKADTHVILGLNQSRLLWNAV